jgi:hypothetical protein
MQGMADIFREMTLVIPLNKLLHPGFRWFQRLQSLDGSVNILAHQGLLLASAIMPVCRLRVEQI